MLTFAPNKFYNAHKISREKENQYRNTWML